MGIKRSHTVKALFRRFALSLVVLLGVAIFVPILLQTTAVNMGIATRANQSELQVREIVPTLTVAPDVTKVVLPQGCRYLILDKDFNELYSNMVAEEREDALSYAKGEYSNQGSKRQYVLVVRDNELCVLQYFIGSQFTVSWLPDFFPSPDTLMLALIVVNSLLVITFLTARFAKIFRNQLHPLMEATKEISEQNLDFEVGHSNIKEFEDVLCSFSSMKDNLKSSLEKQWNAEKLQREQIAALAHDLKTPLTVIQGNADLISETELDEEQRLYAEYIGCSSEQMQLYIRTLIDISRATIGYQLHRENIDLPAYVEQLREQINPLCQTKKIELQMEIENLPAALSADKLLLERAIMNVVNNALDYSPQDSSISISMIGNKGSLEISVTDAGPGFSQEDLMHAEEQFYMADHSRSSDLHFGMGLFITKSIIRQHGGQLILSNSKKTGGARVTISISY